MKVTAVKMRQNHISSVTGNRCTQPTVWFLCEAYHVITEDDAQVELLNTDPTHTTLELKRMTITLEVFTA